MSIEAFIVPFTFDFANLVRQEPDDANSEWRLDSHGNRWRLVVFRVIPDGEEDDADPMVEVALESDDEEQMFIVNDAQDVHIEAYVTFILRDARGRVYAQPDWFYPKKIQPQSESDWVWPVARRSEILDEGNNLLHDGNLFIDVHIQLKMPQPLIKAPPSLGSKMLQLLEDEEDKDVSFRVGGEIISAHKLILKKDPSVLFSFCEENEDGSPISIDDTTPEIFRMLLRYIYGEEIPPMFQGVRDDPRHLLDEAVRANADRAKDVIDAANRFGVVGLKLAVEHNLVETMVITATNVADWLIFSDAKTCALLKEQATAVFVSQSEDLLNSDATNQLRESPRLLTELMMEISRSANPRRGFVDEVSRLSVTELRNQLMEAGLDVDGSKEMLIARLRESSGEQQMDETE